MPKPARWRKADPKVAAGIIAADQNRKPKGRPPDKSRVPSVPASSPAPAPPLIKSNPTRTLIPASVGTDKMALVPTNPRVANIAFRLRWTAETVIKRVENALASPVEQKLYLRVAGGYRIHPESLGKLLDVFRGSRELQECDLEQVSVGTNLRVSRFDDILEKVEHALSILDKSSDGAEYMMSMRNAAELVEAYGEHSLEIFGELVENVSEVAELLNIRSISERRIVGVAVKVLVEEVLPNLGAAPLPLTIDEMFGERRPRE